MARVFSIILGLLSGKIIIKLPGGQFQSKFRLAVKIYIDLYVKLISSIDTYLCVLISLPDGNEIPGYFAFALPGNVLVFFCLSFFILIHSTARY